MGERAEYPQKFGCGDEYRRSFLLLLQTSICLPIYAKKPGVPLARFFGVRKVKYCFLVFSLIGDAKNLWR
ncbi:MAG: hypothetical protein RR051_01750 [Clostridiales bacterium]